MVEYKETTAKILVVSDESFSSQLIEYALKMAQRLDFEILTLNVNEKIMLLSNEEERTLAKSLFQAAAKTAACQFAAEGRAMGIKVASIIDINTRTAAIAVVKEQEPGIRYILSEPEPKQTSGSDDRVQNPVFNLVSSE
jgi:hypothetical protein